MSSLLIRNGEIVTALDRYESDVYIEDGIIKAVGNNLEFSADRMIDAKGHYLFPGAVDVHTHLELPFMGEVSTDDFESGTIAGIAGGTTSLIDFVVPGKEQSLIEALEDWKQKAKNAVSDYGFHMVITRYSDQVAKEMGRCVQQEGVTSFKAFMAYKGAVMVDDGELMSILKTAKSLGALVSAHCENGELVAELQDRMAREGKLAPMYHEKSRPSFVEGEATHRFTALARAIDVPIYVVHVSCAEAVEAISKARSMGQSVFGETCPQYLLLDDSVYQKPDFAGAAYVMSPPIRPRGHADALWGALKSGQLQTVATDHCPFHLKGQKEMGRDDFRKIPNGGPGIENRLALLYTYGVLENRINLNQLVDIACTRPARLFGMYPRKGAIMVGADADIVIWNPEPENVISAKTHHHRNDVSIYEGFQTKGAPSWVVVDGKVQFDEGKLNVEKGAGKFIKRRPVEQY